MSHAELGLTGTELQLVIAEGDENADGYIDVSRATDTTETKHGKTSVNPLRHAGQDLVYREILS